MDMQVVHYTSIISYDVSIVPVSMTAHHATDMQVVMRNQLRLYSQRLLSNALAAAGNHNSVASVISFFYPCYYYYAE
jgi:hypothetical protein